MKGIKNLTVRALCEGAIMLAMALILSLINLVPSAWNFGGSVTLEMLPIIVFCIRWGFGPGMIVSFAYSVLTMLIGNGIAYGWQSIIGDYLIAFTLLGFAGLFHGKKNGFVCCVRTALPCALCRRRNDLGRVHACRLLRHDHDDSVVLFRALQRLLYDPELCSDAGRRTPASAQQGRPFAHERRRHPQIMRFPARLLFGG